MAHDHAHHPHDHSHDQGEGPELTEKEMEERLQAYQEAQQRYLEGTFHCSSSS
ncbi:MAG TPA: hypothetical protein VHE12_10355 [bacterium]|nr:hypothetical protein [bacterium]